MAARSWNAEQQTFVRQAAQASQMEVDMTTTAKDKAQHERRKDSAHQLEQDHARALEDSRRIGSQANRALDKAPAATQASMEQMQNASGRGVRSAVRPARDRRAPQEHRRVRAPAGHGHRELLAFVEKALPVMRQHLQEAESLMQELGR